MNSLLDQLHDIEGLDPISWWPLAIGWWIVIVIGVVLISLTAWFIVHKLAFMRSWKNDTLQKLAALENELSDATARETAINLSEYLRRIALRRFSRKECAGLIGEAWLKWLTEQDLKQFDWKAKGRILIEAPYSPVHSKHSAKEIRDLIQAARDWVR